MSSLFGNNSRITALLGLAGYLSALVVSACFHTHAHHAQHASGDGACCTVGLHAHSHLPGASGHSHHHGDHHHHSHGHHSHDGHSHDGQPATQVPGTASAEPVPTEDRTPSPPLPHRCDDCGICQFLAQASLSPCVLSLDAASALVTPLARLSWSPPAPSAITVQPARGPPSLMG